MTNIHYTVICADNDKFVVEMVVTEKFKLSIFRKYRGVDQKYHKNYKTLGIVPIDSFPFFKGLLSYKKIYPLNVYVWRSRFVQFLGAVVQCLRRGPKLGTRSKLGPGSLKVPKKGPILLSSPKFTSEFETQSEAGKRMVFETHSKHGVSNVFQTP